MGSAGWLFFNSFTHSLFICQIPIEPQIYTWHTLNPGDRKINRTWFLALRGSLSREGVRHIRNNYTNIILPYMEDFIRTQRMESVPLPGEAWEGFTEEPMCE